MSGRVRGAAQVAAVLVLVLFTGACGRGNTQAEQTPIAALEDFSFEEFLTDAPPSGSPSPSPSLVPVGGSSGSSSRPRSSGTAPASKPSGPASCPSGRVTGEMSQVSVADTNETNRDGVTIWEVRASGNVVNQTSQSVRDIRVRVTLHTPNAESDEDTTVLAKWVGRTGTSSWSVRFDEYESEDEPSDDDVKFAITGWSWGDERLSQCPTPGFSG